MDEDARIRVEALKVPRSARYAIRGGGGDDPPDEVWLVCHGYGQLASRFIRRFDVISTVRRLIVAPEALSRFYLSDPAGSRTPTEKVGASWMTREDREAEILDQGTYFDLLLEHVLHGLDRSKLRLVVLGFSQGTAAVCRWAVASETAPAEIILWGGAVPADVLEPEQRARLKRSSITIVVGSQDPIATAELIVDHRAQLDAAGVQYRFVAFDGGHDIESKTLIEIAARTIR